MLWILFVLLLFPAAFAGYAVGHYTSLGKPPTTITVNVGGTATTPTTSGATTTSPATTTNSSVGAVAAGKTVFADNGCGSCHAFTPAGSSGTIGPNLDTAPAESAKADGNMDLAAFIQQSIVDPNAYIAKGYTSPSQMPGTFGTSLSKKQLHDLVAFVLSGTQQ
jgi:cytochrome c551/c552